MERWETSCKSKIYGYQFQYGFRHFIDIYRFLSSFYYILYIIITFLLNKKLIFNAWQPLRRVFITCFVSILWFWKRHHNLSNYKTRLNFFPCKIRTKLWYFYISSNFIHHCGLRNTRSLLQINTSRRHTLLFTRHKDASKIEGDDESTKNFILTFFTSSSLYDGWSTF